MLWLALLAALLHTASASLCPDGFELVRNGECYKEVEVAKYDDAMNEPANAKKECSSFEALPIIIRNQEDNDYWVSVAKANLKKEGSSGGNIFLGLECNVNSHWQWMDGSKITYRPDQDLEDLDGYCDNAHDSWAYRCMWAIDPISGTWGQYCFEKHYMDVYCIFHPQSEGGEVNEDCSNFSFDGDDDVCYQIGTTATNFTEANAVCRSLGASVASVHNDRENSFLRRLAVSKGHVSGLMLGGQSNGGNSFAWSDGTKFDYSNFAPGYPKAGSGDCLSMQTDNVNGRWKNVNCTENLSFACARQTGVSLPTCDGALHKEGDIIYSPGFPSNASEPCDYILQADPGMLVEVEILFLEANSCCDHLVLFEGSLGGAQIVELSGERENGKKFRTTSQNVMRASWVPKGGVNVRGMMITFRGVPK